MSFIILNTFCQLFVLTFKQKIYLINVKFYVTIKISPIQKGIIIENKAKDLPIKSKYFTYQI